MDTFAPLLDPDTPPSSPSLLRSLLMSQPATDGVELLLWPEEEDRREEVAGKEVPCLLILGADTPAPVCGALEDWVRPPVPAADVEARCAALRVRVACATAPIVDADGGLWFLATRVDLSAGQIPLARMLVEHYRTVVRREALAAVHVEAGGQDTDEALKAAISRLAQRVGGVGLAIRTIRGRGHLLEPVIGCGSIHDAAVMNASEFGP
jgi:hypothetical protein